VTKAWEDAISSCTVVEVGADCTIKKGDRVQINPYAYRDITGSPLKMIKEDDVLAYVG
jgi:co-chaperonin GroES (HSP10)